MNNYGKELILDLHECDVRNFNRTRIRRYFKILCDDKIDMERCDLHWWDFKGQKKLYNEAPPHLKGISAIQFIKTSDIVIHTLDTMERAYINIFSCKDFNSKIAREFTERFFDGRTVNGLGKGITICRM